MLKLSAAGSGQFNKDQTDYRWKTKRIRNSGGNNFAVKSHAARVAELRID